MKLYKYISSDIALKKVVGGNIKFATLDSLNDPTELLPKIYETELIESLREKRLQGYTENDLIDLKRQELLFKKLSPETMAIEAPKTIERANSTVKLPFFDNLDNLKKKFNKTVELMSSRCGLFCVSTRYDSLPMWAHYANNAKGYVVEFDGLHDFFLGDGTGILNQITDVRYIQRRSGINFKSGSYNSLFFEKNQDWSYECEKRIVIDLDSCQKVRIGDDDIYLYQINKKMISKVIFGWKISQAAIKNTIKEVYAINPQVEVAIATIREGLIELQ
ncbi:MAG: hypothetical protein C4330_14165 [Chitinophagaceae bacterium]